MDLMAIDPGDRYVGMALFTHHDDGWQCTWAQTWDDRAEFLRYLADTVQNSDVDRLVVVFERFILEPARASALAGTELETSQLIGAIRWIVETEGPALVGQTNKIKAPTRALLRHLGVTSVAKRLKTHGDHAFDAELHGWHYVLKALGQQPSRSALRGAP